MAHTPSVTAVHRLPATAGATRRCGRCTGDPGGAGTRCIRPSTDGSGVVAVAAAAAAAVAAAAMAAAMATVAWRRLDGGRVTVGAKATS